MHESMFETFLKTAYQNDKKADDERALVEAMKKLPPEVLFKLASGETKLGSSYLKACSPSGCEGMEWVEQFKDTPLFEQALQLEQQAIQLEQMEQQYRAQRDAEREQEPKFWEMQDRIRLQKRMLGLQLAAGQLQQAGAAGGAAPTAPGGAPPLPPAAAEAAGGAPPPADGKVAFALTERGHKFDTERASMKREHLLDEARLHQHYNALGHNDPETNTNPAKLINVFRFGPDMYHPTAEARHQAYVAAQHAQGRNAYNPFGGLLTPVPEEQGATSGLLGMVGKVGPKKEEGAKKEAFDRAAALGQRMAQGDYERAVTMNLASELGRSLAKTAFAVTDAGHKFDAADYGAQRDAIGARREARKDYRGAAPGMHAGHTALDLGTLSVNPLLLGGSPGLGSEVADMLRERHLNYAASQHAAGRNAYNPLGGLLTPTDRETKAKEKKALDVGALAGLGQKAVGFLGKNPGAALGAAAGAAGGLAHGLQKDQNGQRHLLSGLAQGAAGAAGGALAGHAAQHIGGAVRGGASLGQATKSYGQQLQQAGSQAATRVQGALKPAATTSASPAAAARAAPTAGAASVAPTLPAGAQGRVAPTLPAASQNPSLIGATNQALNFQRAPADVQAAVRSNPLVASGEIAPEAAHQLMSWSAKGGVTPQAIQQMNSRTPRPAGFVDPREAATRVGG